MKVNLLVLATTLCSCISTYGQIGIDNTFSEKNEALDRPWNFTFDVADNSNRLLVVGVVMEASESSGGLNAVNKITFEGRDLLKVVDGGVSNGSSTNDNEIWILTAPNVGSGILSIDYQTNQTFSAPHVVVYSLYNAEQSNLVIASSSNSLSTNSAISTTLTNVQEGSLIIDLVVASDQARTYNEQSGQTNVISYGAGGQRSKGGYKLSLLSGDYVMSYSPSGTMTRQSITAIAINSAMASSSSGLWEENGNDVSYTAGNVGIGTSTPSVELEVKGTIRSEEVRVEAVNAPDYVFEADYDLRSLREIEEYIQEFGHLPEVPSAAELEEKGMGVSEMNLLLLKKIEELTLHAIRQEELLQEQRRLLEMQQGQINSLRKGRKVK